MLKVLKDMGFRQQLTIIFSIGMVVLALISTFVISELSSHTVRQRLINEGLSLTKNFADASTLALLYGSEESAEEVVKTALLFPDIDWVEIIDQDNNILFPVKKAGPVKPLVSVPSGDLRLYRESSVYWEFLTPVYTNQEEESPFSIGQFESELIGHVRVVMSKATLKEMTAKIFRYNLMVSFGLAGILLLVLLGFTNRLTNPIKRLAETMRTAQAGEKNVRAELRGAKDIVEMERAFNKMMSVLEGREEALKTARDQALISAKVKEEFAANVSHELRTPMNGILGMLELLGDMGINEKQREYVNVARNSGESLLALINDILDFSKNESEKMNLQVLNFDLGEILEDLTSLFTPDLNRKNLDFAYVIDPSIPRYLMGDGDRLRQVLINLIGNALKFTHKGYIEVDVDLLEESENNVTLRFSVSDTGIGIANEVKDKIFESFSQADDSTTREYGGTGLGLAICKQLVSMMGADIELESESGKGSTFWFALPMLKQAAQKKGAFKRIESRNKRVLIVDDCELIRRTLTQFFKREGFDCQTATNEGEVLQSLRLAEEQGRLFDIVLMDEILENIEGLNLLYKMKNMPGYNSYYTVLMINGGLTQEKTALDTLVSSTLSKPIRYDNLSKCIDKLINQLPAGELQGKAENNVVQGAGSLFFKGSRILVVEDNRSNQIVASGMLERLGCTVTVVDDGLDCLDIVSRNQFDLILMDCHMPNMDGYETTIQIRNWEAEESRIPIVAMTANVQKGEHDKCLAIGMDDYLSKPLTLERLKEKLLAWLPPQYHQADIESDRKSADAEDSYEHYLAQHAIVDEHIVNELKDQIGDKFFQMLNAFLEDMPGYVETLIDGVSKEDPTAFADAAHTIKGAVSNFGAISLAQKCKKMEKMGRAGETLGAHVLLDELVDECHQATKYLKERYSKIETHIDAKDVPSSAVIGGAQVQPLILVVDDERSMRFGISEVLRNEGFRVEEAADGKEALDFCQKQNANLVLMDGVMPNMDGFTACSLIKKLPDYQNTPVLLVTALDDDESTAKAFSAGATDYISKPVNFSVLRKRVNRLLEASHAQHHIHQLAYKDALTNLPNRVMFSNKLEEMLERVRLNDSKIALMFLDLDRFKLINDSMGHEAGDLLLKYFADRVKGCLRKCDVVARFGGDEFTVLLDEIKSHQVAVNVAEKIHEKLSRPFSFMSKEIYVSVSIGIVIAPDHGLDTGTLLKNADMAMYRAKGQNKKYQFYETDMTSDLNRRLELEHDLRGAVERDELVLYYQPQEDLETGRIVGMEALVRWEHPDKGLIPPNEFIPLAEETGQILEIGNWVFQEACSRIKSWRDQGVDSVFMAINLSAHQLSSPGFVDRLAYILKSIDLPANCIELEITESTIMENPEKVIVVLDRLKEMGFLLAIDDFGTGYSSLNYLKRFPIDVLKIDRSFVIDLPGDKVDADIVKTIIGLAHVLGVTVIAEGVEDEAQKQFLRNEKCNIAQGYLLSKPIPAEQFEDAFLTKMIRGEEVC